MDSLLPHIFIMVNERDLINEVSNHRIPATIWTTLRCFIRIQVLLH